MRPSLALLENRQKDLKREKTTLSQLFDHYARGRLTRGQGLALDVFGPSARNTDILETRTIEMGDANIEAVVESYLHLISTVSKIGQRYMMTRNILLKTMPTRPATPVQAGVIIDRVKELVAEKERYMQMTGDMLGYLADKMPEKHEKLAAELARAKQAKPGEFTDMDENGQIGVCRADLAQTLGQADADLALAYQQGADAVLSAIRTHFAYVGASTFAQGDLAKKRWAVLGPSSDGQLRLAGDFLKMANSRIMYAKQQQAPWTRGMNAG